jgi:hypothetical protein
MDAMRLLQTLQPIVVCRCCCTAWIARARSMKKIDASQCLHSALHCTPPDHSQRKPTNIVYHCAHLPAASEGEAPSWLQADLRIRKQDDHPVTAIRMSRPSFGTKQHQLCASSGAFVVRLVASSTGLPVALLRQVVSSSRTTLTVRIGARLARSGQPSQLSSHTQQPPCLQ